MASCSEKPSRLELWGGIDSTCNRVGDLRFDQLQITGHDTRTSDLSLFASLGLAAVRYPVLWERVAGEGIGHHDWSWPDERLSRLRELDIRPIAGLLHHGNGPDGMELLDPQFPEEFARYARAVAECYPWLDAYTPVNEPLTTARFSGLYGLWYPHARDRRIFLQILFAQCRATVLAMRAIREINPSAELLQTEDLGTIYSTPALAYQAAYENERRWLTWDLLCGRLKRGHALWTSMLDAGASESELEWFLENPCSPDVIGIDHYLSSDRFQDEHLLRYTGLGPGDSGRHRYVDVMAPRARSQAPDRTDLLLQTVWERYGLPVALTETHNGCTREEQMRWFVECWEGAEAARASGVDVRAVTAWSILGIQGWDALCTGGGRYETGVFDIRSPEPRPTAMVPLLQSLSAGEPYVHPLMEVPGWWRRPVRFCFGVAVRENGDASSVDPSAQRMNEWPSRHPLLIAGPVEPFADAVAQLCDLRGIPWRFHLWPYGSAPNRTVLRRVLGDFEPWAVVHAIGYAEVAADEADPAACRDERTVTPTRLAEACAETGSRLLTFSSDLVFRGRKGRPYVESDRVGPRTVTGQYQALGERRVLNAWPEALVIRSGPQFGPGAGMLERVPGEARTNLVSPTYVPDLINAALDLLVDGESGIWHLAHGGQMSRNQLSTQLADLSVGSSVLLEPASRPTPTAILGQHVSQALESERGWILPSVDDALARYAAEVPSFEPTAAEQAS